MSAGSWGKDSLWDDGRAEVAIYDSERMVYGKPRFFKEQIVIVKEDFRSDTLVKADEPKKQKTIRVFKINNIQKFETENYPYSYLGSVFVKEAPLKQIVKITVGSQEWCGNTFKLYTGKADGTGGSLQWHSYFDGEADHAIEILLKENDYFEDQLVLSLRELPFKAGYETNIRLWDSLITNRGTTPQVREAVLKVVGEEIVQSRAGALPSWKIVLEMADGKDVYWFEKAEPHVLTKSEQRNGQKRLIYGRARWSYWDRRLPKPNILK